MVKTHCRICGEPCDGKKLIHDARFTLKPFETQAPVCTSCLEDWQCHREDRIMAKARRKITPDRFKHEVRVPEIPIPQASRQIVPDTHPIEPFSPSDQSEHAQQAASEAADLQVPQVSASSNAHTVGLYTSTALTPVDHPPEASTEKAFGSHEPPRNPRPAERQCQPWAGSEALGNSKMSPEVES